MLQLCNKPTRTEISHCFQKLVSKFSRQYQKGKIFAIEISRKIKSQIFKIVNEKVAYIFKAAIWISQKVPTSPE